MAITDLGLFAHLKGHAVAPHPLHISQQLPKKRMATKRGRIAHQQQLAPCAGHAHVHAADVRQEAPEAGRWSQSRPKLPSPREEIAIGAIANYCIKSQFY